MVVLDTNHFSELERDSSECQRLRRRIEQSGEAPFTAVITAEEVMSGWLARVRGKLPPERLIDAYNAFQNGLESLNGWTLLPWNADVSAIFETLRQRGVRIGTLDLRIASICLNYEATLLTRNLADFRQVPGLRVENWLD
ncbi:MAG: type II toxin-antitoxin system VapC family toxin [Prosthecobacter sp.]|nr:type II toxin-antitoxin system VapC family toxin [Prosthecobacter sp.]